jgi:hypothetical protein
LNLFSHYLIATQVEDIAGAGYEAKQEFKGN